MKNEEELRLKRLEHDISSVRWQLHALLRHLGKRIDYDLYDAIPPGAEIVRDVCKECGK